MVCGGVSQTPAYLSGKGKESCQSEFERQIEIFLKNDVDFLLAEVSLDTKVKYPIVGSFVFKLVTTLEIM